MTLAVQKCDTMLQCHWLGSILPVSPFVFVCAGAECGTEVLLEPNGAVRSPAYPNAYRNNSLCHWVIYAPEGHIVKVKTTL